jgi:hypothetical protein
MSTFLPTTLTGSINGTNTTFTIPAAPTSLELYRNGVLLKSTVDYTLSTTTITFLAGAIPQTGDTLTGWVFDN